MSLSNTMPIAVAQDQMWKLIDDGRKLRMTLPSRPVAGLPQPLRLNVDFEAAVVDRMIERLLILRAQMVPPPQRSKAN